MGDVLAPNARVLLIDDDDDVRRIGLMSLTRVGGWDAVGASSGQEGVELARATQPALVLLDVMMPGLDGPATLAELREQPGLAEVPVIFLTAKAQRRDVDRLLALGAAGVIPKPFDPLTLADQVRALVGRR